MYSLRPNLNTDSLKQVNDATFIQES